jgi:hypothetical protein
LRDSAPEEPFEDEKASQSTRSLVGVADVETAIGLAARRHGGA